jgi:hypothetical protein
MTKYIIPMCAGFNLVPRFFLQIAAGWGGGGGGGAAAPSPSYAHALLYQWIGRAVANY